MLEKTLQSPLDCKEIKPVNPKGNQSWIFNERTDAEAETPILWLPDAKNWLIGKDPDAGKDWRQEGEGDNRGLDGWMASLTRWTWVWVSSRNWWKTGKPGVLQSMGSQRVTHDLATEELISILFFEELWKKAFHTRERNQLSFYPLYLWILSTTVIILDPKDWPLKLGDYDR